MTPRARFAADVALYDLDIVATSAEMPGKDALLLEKAIHRALLGQRHSPAHRLRSGNTECYEATEEALRRFASIVSTV